MSPLPSSSSLSVAVVLDSFFSHSAAIPTHEPRTKFVVHSFVRCCLTRHPSCARSAVSAPNLPSQRALPCRTGFGFSFGPEEPSAPRPKPFQQFVLSSPSFLLRAASRNAQTVNSRLITEIPSALSAAAVYMSLVRLTPLNTTTLCLYQV